MSGHNFSRVSNGSTRPLNWSGCFPNRGPRAPLANLAQQAAALPASPTWRAYRLNANLGGIAPPEFVRAIDVPGLRVERIAYQNNQWTLEGVLYAK